MNSVDLAMQLLGPKGGDLEGSIQPTYRRESLHAAPVEAGLALHQFVDKAVPGLKNEQAWHRMAAYMLLAGRTNSEIAMAAGMHVQTVSNLRAQRWFQELLATLANESGAELHGLVLSEAQDAFLRIVDIAKTAESERVRLAANIQIFEQANGKAVQKIIANTTHTHLRPEEEMAGLLSELASLTSRNVTPQPALPCLPNPS